MKTLEDNINVIVDLKNEVYDYRVKVAEIYGQISANVSEAKNLLQRLGEMMREEEKAIQAIKTGTEVHLRSASNLNESMSSNLSDAARLQAEIESKRDRIEGLLGLANDAEQAPLYGTLSTVIKGICKGAIWLSARV